MNYILFIFGKHEEPEKMVKLICQNIQNKLESEQINYYHGDESFIITFQDEKNFEEVKTKISSLLGKSELVYVLLPYTTDNLSVNMVNEMYDLLFGEKVSDSKNEIDEVEEEVFLLFTNYIEELESEMDFKKIKKKKTLDEILDKILEVGYEKLTKEEKKLLNEYSKK